jgi:hypothetical protein
MSNGGWAPPCPFVSGGKSMPQNVQVGDLVRLRKPHPCGSYEWLVVRIGADIGLKCQVCSRRVLMDRRNFKKRVKTMIRRSEDWAEK